MINVLDTPLRACLHPLRSFPNNSPQWLGYLALSFSPSRTYSFFLKTHFILSFIKPRSLGESILESWPLKSTSLQLPRAPSSRYSSVQVFPRSIYNLLVLRHWLPWLELDDVVCRSLLQLLLGWRSSFFSFCQPHNFLKNHQFLHPNSDSNRNLQHVVVFSSAEKDPNC